MQFELELEEVDKDMRLDKNEDYKPRLLDAYLRELLAGLPAIALDGPKAVGKTESARRISKSLLSVDSSEVRTYLRTVPSAFEDAEKPLLLDEWQFEPSVWNKVRRLVDEGAESGSYILTGSAYPEEASIHSGAGRIVPVRMRPLSLEERGLDVPVVRIGDCLKGLKNTQSSFNGSEHAKTIINGKDYISEIFRSGFPDIWLSDKKTRKRKLRAYMQVILERELPEAGYVVRKPDALMLWMKAYAAATATNAQYKKILDAATPGESDKPSKDTTLRYRSMLTNLWLIDSIPMWMPSQGSFARLKQTHKHFLADPALSAYLMGLDEEILLRGEEQTALDEDFGSIAGRLFESLVALSLQTYATVNDADLGYLRTRNGDREVDFVVHSGRDIVAIEVKFDSEVHDDDVSHLNWLHESYGSRLREKILVYAGPYAYRRPEDGVLVVPAALLGA